MRQLREFDTVRVVRANVPPSGAERDAGWPAVGDTGTIVDMSPGRNGKTVYTVEDSDADGRTVWLDSFSQDQLEWISSPDEG